MNWYRTICAVLEDEPETWLAYLKGQRFDEIEHIREAKPRFRGAFLRLLVFSYLLVRDVRLRRDAHRYGKCHFLVYAGTHNQKMALDAMIGCLRGREQTCLALADARWIRTTVEGERYVPADLSPVDMLKSFILVGRRLARLRSAFANQDSRLWARHLDTFCETLRNLVYFEKILRKTKPEIVVVSNDHSPANRALLALARHHGIRSAYLQHASVSSFFPALDFDYSFLDGSVALSVYEQCEGNHPPSTPLRTNRWAFLSGQKIPVARRKHGGQGSVGIALNKLDDPERVHELVSALAEAGFHVRLRWHPGMGVRERKRVERPLSGRNGLEFSEPRRESVSTFLSGVHTLVAGNSSIHLEAAVAGVLPVCYEPDFVSMRDYYGYVRHGVSRPAGSPEEAVAIAVKVANRALALNPRAIREYSATFATPWEGSEGALVAEILVALEEGVPAEELQGVSLDMAKPWRAGYPDWSAKVGTPNPTKYQDDVRDERP